MPVLCDLIGPGAPLDATTASVIGLPRAGPRGSPWRFVRAALPHSLASELTSSTDRTTLGSYAKNISAILDQRKKASLERQRAKTEEVLAQHVSALQQLDRAQQEVRRLVDSKTKIVVTKPAKGKVADEDEAEEKPKRGGAAKKEGEGDEDEDEEDGDDEEDDKKKSKKGKRRRKKGRGRR